ncbi:MAG: hypothetical protein PHD76_14825 [Methylacidiphilales bacterium]|nr:hypothetical protein [Candidatus Methylacidiphilales bacterium]
MRTATVRELRNRYLDVFKWIEAGEKVAISRRGAVIAWLVPEPAKSATRYDWKKSAALCRDKSKLPLLTKEQSVALLAESQGKW